MYCFNSKKIKKNDTYLVLPGGEKYIDEALSKGAKSFILLDREDLAEFGNWVYDHPSKNLSVIGVTGTNGKTTVCHLVEQGLKREGKKTFVQGTLSSDLTTPESFETLKQMRVHQNKGGTHFVMEVSSHGIHQGRILGIEFDIKCLTNITHDHLDYHKTFEEYKRVKESFLYDAKTIIRPTTFMNEQIPVDSNLKGGFNNNNMKAAKSILKACGISEKSINITFSKAIPIPGRFEFIKENQAFDVVVDYAHTPAGLEEVCKTAKELMQKNASLILVFGCGGDRDLDKRAKMGKVAYEYADKIIITQDNPRYEDSQKIVSDIIEGIPKSAKNYQVINDRKLAILKSLKLAKKNDFILIAGKGHETEQIINGCSMYCDDRNIVRKELQNHENMY